MSKWFNLQQDYPRTTLTQKFDIDTTTPGVCSNAPPDLTKMGGGPMMLIIAAQLNLVRDLILQEGETLLPSLLPACFILCSPAGGWRPRCFSLTCCLIQYAPLSPHRLHPVQPSDPGPVHVSWLAGDEAKAQRCRLLCS
jgi:hypothetical protein